MYKLLMIFILFYPYITIPIANHHYYTFPKAIFLICYTSILWTILLISYIGKNKSLLNYKLDSLNILSGLFIILIIISTIFSIDRNLAFFGEDIRFEGLVAWLSYFTLFFIARHMIETEQIKKLYKPLLYTGVVVSIYGILQHFHLDFLPRATGKENWTRSYAFFDNPNFFGSYLVLMIFIGVSLYLIAKSKKIQIVYLLSVSIIFIALLYSLTRSAWIGTMVGIILVTTFVVWKRKDVLKRWVLLISAFILIFTVINFTESNQFSKRANTFVNDVNQLIVAEDSGRAGSSRWFIWQTALPLVKQYFWLGSGPDTFGIVFPHEEEEIEKYFSNPNAIVDKAHNEYLQIAITMSVPSLLIYLLFLTRIVYSSSKAALAFKGKEQLLMVGLLAAIIGYLVQAFFNISVITVAPYFWIFLGMASRISDFKK